MRAETNTGGCLSGLEELPMYDTFSLTLMVNHACNLRCSYCYTGAKINRPMPLEVGFAAIDRALASVESHGKLELGFFGGEPLLEAGRIGRWIQYAEEKAEIHGVEVSPGLTTNGTLAEGDAWKLMTRPGLQLAVSCDGPAAVHDRHRRQVNGQGSAGLVAETLQRLVAAGKEFRVVTVVRPDSLADLPATLDYFHAKGVRWADFSPDLWTKWTAGDLPKLEAAVEACAARWLKWLPNFSLNWFDEKVAHMTRVPVAGTTARCGFGAGEIAVAPSGNLYPCERLMGEDAPGNPMRLAGNAMDGVNFLPESLSPGRSAAACAACPIQAVCSTTCRCSNYVRTGNVGTPDGLLCRLDQACFRAVCRVLQPVEPAVIPIRRRPAPEPKSSSAVVSSSSFQSNQPKEVA